MRTIRFGRVIAAAVAAEVVGVAALIALVAIFGPHSATEAQPFAERLGAWVGPISGFVFCTIGAWSVARAVPRDARVANGVGVGLVGALLDVTIVLALGAGVTLLVLLSNAGRIAAGTLGGWWAWRGNR